MKNQNLLLLLMLLVFSGLMSFKAIEAPLFSYPAYFPAPPYNFKENPLKKEVVELGRALFYEPLLSRDGTVTCESCHLAYTSFTHVDHTLSHGIDNRIGSRNSPALINLAWNKHFMWDGAIHHLDVQALAPIENHLEMDEKLPNVLHKLQQSTVYRKKFEMAFGDTAVTGERMLKAMSQFMLTLVSANSKYDKVKRNEISFNEYELKGYALFQKNCNVCHTEPLFTNGGFENNGLRPDSVLKDVGRMKISLNPKDSLKFKVPTLRNIELTYPYMHDGRFSSLQMVVFHYNDGLHASPTLSKHLKKSMNLSESDKRCLVAFLKTLTDEEFAHNPKFAYPR